MPFREIAYENSSQQLPRRPLLGYSVNKVVHSYPWTGAPRSLGGNLTALSCANSSLLGSAVNRALFLEILLEIVHIAHAHARRRCHPQSTSSPPEEEVAGIKEVRDSEKSTRPLH
jgi:hypothetical protein